MAKTDPLAGYVWNTTRGLKHATVLGFDVLYEYERADPSVGIDEAYFILAVKVGGQWLSLGDAFTEDFSNMLHEHIADEVIEAAAEDFDIPEAA